MSIAALLRSSSSSSRLLALGVLFAAAAAPLAATQVLGPTGDPVNRALGLRAGQTARVGLSAARSGRLLAAMDVGSARGILVLEPVDVRGEGYRLLVQQADGSYAGAASGPTATFRGEVLGVPGSAVAASLQPDGLRARLLLTSGQEYWLEPLPVTLSAPGSGTHALYRGDAVLDPGGSCALEALPDAALHTIVAAPGDGDAQAAGTLKVAQLACDADFEYYGHYGTVAAVENRIHAVINAMNLQYEAEVGITHEITTIIVRTSSSQPYTSTDPNTLLNQFRTQWTTNHGNVTRDVAHLFTGKEVDGNVIGIAWLGVICNSSYGYGLAQSDFTGNFAYTTDLSAHEIGHNWNANHCTCPSYTMNPYITGTNTFDPVASIPVITSFRNSVGCLTDGGGDPPPPPDPGAGLASADYATATGTITAGTYASTHTSNDGYESLTEQQTGGKPSTKTSMLDHTWTLSVPTGHNFSLSLEAHHSANSENDHFQFLYSLDNGAYKPMVTVTKTGDDDAAQSFAFTEDVTGNLFVKVRDTNATAGLKVVDSVHVDRLAVLVDTTGADVTPPAAPKNLSAQPGNGQVTLDWADSNAQDLAGYLVSRAVTSGGPYLQLNIAPIAASAYVDATAGNGTTFYYVVKARDTAANLSLASAQVSATPVNPGAPAVSMHVQQVLVSAQAVTGGFKQGRADVTILNDKGNPVAGATVTGAFSGTLNQSVSAVTGANGVAVLLTTQTAKGNFSLACCVSNVTHATLAYLPGQNVQTCGSK